MKLSRRRALHSVGGVLSLPLLESTAMASESTAATPMRFLVVGNPFGAHPDHFFPKDFGKEFSISPTLQSLDWLKDRMTIVSHTDHHMVSGHGRELSFLSGVLPADAQAFAEKNMSIDQLLARHVGSQVRFPSIGASVGSSIRMSWTANGVEKSPITDPDDLFDHLFSNLSPSEKVLRKDLLQRNESILDAVGSQFKELHQQTSKTDQQTLDQYQTAVRELEQTLRSREAWLDKDKPTYDVSHHFSGGGVTIENRYHAIFDMIAYAFQTDLTRVASVEFPSALRYTEIDGVNRSYHGCTHNGKREDVTSELVAIESFQISQLSRCLKKLDSIPAPNSNGTLLDQTIVLFGSGMGYGGTHSNRNLPIFVAGGGFQHLGHVDAKDASGNNMPLCNLFVSLIQQFGMERDQFNTSTGSFDFG